jgi:hypothetical protein
VNVLSARTLANFWSVPWMAVNIVIFMNMVCALLLELLRRAPPAWT